MEKKTTKILWLSDIHIKEDKFNRYNIDKYLCESITFLKNNYINLDYLLISGDIAYSGQTNEYDLFINNFLNEIKNIYNEIKILSIPGNHDIMWNKLSHKENDFFTSDYNARNSFIKKQNETSFGSYITFFKKNILPTFIDNTENSFNDENSRMTYGYVLDTKAKICFVLINSAWLSFGQGLIQAYLNNKDIFKYEESIKDNLNTILSNITEYPEFGSQMIGSDFLKDLKMYDNIFNKYRDFTVITVMHHPPHWLHYNEQYGIDSKSHKSKILNQVLNNSHILLTGHEHLPLFVNSITNNIPIHFKGGCFIDDYRTDLDLQNNNRFSILEIIRNQGASFVKNTDCRIEIIPNEYGSEEIKINEINTPIIYLKKKIMFDNSNIQADFNKEFNIQNYDFDKIKTFNNFFKFYEDLKNKSMFAIISLESYTKNYLEIINFINKNISKQDKIELLVTTHDLELKGKYDSELNNDILDSISKINIIFENYKIEKINLFNKFKYLILNGVSNCNNILDFNKIVIRFNIEKTVKIF